jgi:hypothetical protein
MESRACNIAVGATARGLEYQDQTGLLQFAGNLLVFALSNGAKSP